MLAKLLVLLLLGTGFVMEPVSDPPAPPPEKEEEADEVSLDDGLDDLLGGHRKPLEGRVQDNLRMWKTGGLRRISDDRPFGDVIKSHPTRPSERRLAAHPSLKPQSFLRQIVFAVLPLGEGMVVDPFAGSGSTLAAAEAVGYSSIGLESDRQYFDMAQSAVPALANLET